GFEPETSLHAGDAQSGGERVDRILPIAAPGQPPQEGELAAELALSLDQQDLMTPPSCSRRRLHAGRTTSDDDNAFRLRWSDHRQPSRAPLGFAPGDRVKKAGHLTVQGDTEHALVLAEAPDRLLLATLKRLANKERVRDVRSRHRDHICAAFLDEPCR